MSSVTESGNHQVGAAGRAAAESSVAIEASIASAIRALLGFRQADGHWVFELEADCTIPT
jgi:squalene-hopene/tetraprenyl-beta-curcumene cyclase